jgi:2'-5' RNA ligase
MGAGEIMHTALVLTVPEADPLVGHWRERLDPSAAAGMPAHVTLIYPFRESAAIGTGTEAALAGICAATRAFDLTFNAVKRFPGVLWLAPEDSAPAIALTRAISEVFSDCAPYGGAFDEIVPHLTVAHLLPDDEAQLDRIERGFLIECGTRLPLRTRARQATLMEKSGEGRWQERRRFPFSR